MLRNEKLLVSEIERILGLSEQEASGIIGKTSDTAYRRVHEILTSALDRVVEVVHAEKLKFESIEASGQRIPEQEIEEVKKSLLALLTDLSKALIMVRYQRARGQIATSLANYTDSIVRNVIDHIKSVESIDKEKLQEIERLATNARSLLDSLAVLVYECAKKRRERERE
jgi:uncharacterized membrane protein YccC